MKKIEISDITRYNDYFQMTVIFYIEVPSCFDNIIYKDKVAKSYDSNYGVVTIDNVDYFTVNMFLSKPNETSIDDLKTTLTLMYAGSKTKLESFQLKEFDTLIGTSYDGIEWK
jgi:hypothetical protein